MFSNKFLMFYKTTAIASLFALSLSGIAKAETNNKSSKSPTLSTNSPEMKKDVTEMYQKMADCMKTEKSHQECQKEMAKDCPVLKATGRCPIKDGMMGKGAMKSGKMKAMNMNQS